MSKVTILSNIDTKTILIIYKLTQKNGELNLMVKYVTFNHCNMSSNLIALMLVYNSFIFNYINICYYLNITCDIVYIGSY